MDSTPMTPTEELKATLKDLIPQEAIEILDRFFPERTPPLCDSIDQIRYASGQRSVVRFLREL